mgnify:FL=1
MLEEILPLCLKQRAGHAPIRLTDKPLANTAFAVANAPGERPFCYRNKSLSIEPFRLITNRFKLILNVRDLRVPKRSEQHSFSGRSNPVD